MQTVIQCYLAKVKVGRKQSHRNLAVFPLLSEYTTALDYTTLDEALAGGLTEVTEVSQGGAVGLAPSQRYSGDGLRAMRWMP